MVTVSRSGTDNSESLAVFVSLGGNANWNDYSVMNSSNGFSGGNVSIPANCSTATLTIQALDEPAGSEQVVLTLASSAASYEIGGNDAATVTINPDPTVGITPASQSTSQYTSGRQLTVWRRSGSDSLPLTVYYSVSGAGGNEYSVSGGTYSAGGSNGSLTIAASHSTATLTVESNDEPSGSESVAFTLVATGGAGYQVGRRQAPLR